MTHDIKTELTDDQLAEAVGGKGYTGVLTLTGDATIGVDAGSTLTLTGSISDGPAAAGLSKTGAGHLILPATNTY